MELVVFVGLQASGKSTFYRERFAGSHLLVSKDLLRNARNREARQRELVRAAVAAGHSVVVDNTNSRPEDRAPLIALARKYGARVVGYLFEAQLADCLRRNAAREGRARVPAVALHVTHRKLRAPVLEEGFDALWSVRLADRGFEVVPLASAGRDRSSEVDG